jgi:hypothetical protein
MLKICKKIQTLLLFRIGGIIFITGIIIVIVGIIMIIAVTSFRRIGENV